MPGMLDWKIKISADIKDLQNKMHKVEGELGEFEGKDHKVKLDLDTKTLESALKKLDSMLDSLGKGTGDFKQFETLSKDLAKVTSELSGFTKAFGKIDNSGTKSLLDMVQNIDKSLNNLSSHVTDVAKNLGNIGKDSGASSAVAQIENITKANEEAIKSTEKLAEARKKINDNVSVSTKGTSFTSNTSALQQEEKQIQKNINSLNKLLALKSDVKNVKKSSYSGKGNLDYVGIYHSQEEAVSKDLATKSNKLNASLNLILNEDKDAVQELESEVTKLKTSLQSVQDLTKRISKNSSINDLTKEQDVTERLKGYASAYQAIDTRLGELNNEYSLSNKQLEEYITLQVVYLKAKAEKIMNEVASNEFGGVRGYGDVTSKAQLKMLVEESFAKRLGYDSQDVYDGLFKNISDANYDSKHISLFGDNGKKRSLKEVSAQILDYKSSASSLSGVFGANEDIERLNTLNSILNYIKTNEKEIANTDFTAQINRLTAMLENTSGLTFLEEELQELKSYQERLDSVKNTSIDSASTPSSISEQNKVQEELKETQTQAKKTKEALNESNISSEVSAFQQQEKIQNQVTQSIQEQNKAIDESIKKTLTLNDVRQKQWEIIQKTNPKEEGTNSTWVDKPEDAKTFYEVNHKDSDYPFNENYSDDWTVKDKMNVEATGKITVYSSYPIEDGNWVTPSKEEGLSYAGSGKLYSATMDPRDIAWVDAGQGQVAHISDELKEVIDLSTKAETQVQSIDNNTNETGEQSTLNALDDTIAKYETIVSLVKEYYDLSNNKKDTIGISSVRTLAQRRNGDRHRTQAVIEILAEAARSDGLLQIHVRGRDDADVGLLDLRRPDADEFARLQHAQQARLRRMRQFGDLVEEDRTPVGLLEVALAGFERTGEGALLVAEKLRVDRAFGNGRAVDGYIFIVFAGRISVDDLREKLLAHAAFARDEYRQVGRSHAHGDLQRPVQKFRSADDAEALFDCGDIRHLFRNRLFWLCRIAGRRGMGVRRLFEVLHLGLPVLRLAQIAERDGRDGEGRGDQGDPNEAVNFAVWSPVNVRRPRSSVKFSPVCSSVPAC